MQGRVLIIGGGHAGGQCAASLRRKGWEGDIVIAGEEPLPPYQRPPLSKAFLAGDLAAERLFLKPEAFYDKARIELRRGARAREIDRQARKVIFEDGAALGYGALVLATGARPRRLELPGETLPGVGYLRGVADAERLQSRFRGGARLAVIGAGYIGLEVAAVAASRGLKVTVIEIADRVMARVTSATISRFFEELHRARGVDIRLAAGARAFAGGGALEAVELTDGASLPCDVCLIGVGIVPNTELAAAAGLDVEDGVLVDEFARTGDPAIYAVGDCTRHPSRRYGRPLRLESVHNAIEQAKTAAAAICGAPAPYDEPPWFWSDQYDVKLQTVGVLPSRPDAEILRGDRTARKFSVFYLEEDRIAAVDSVNAPADHMISRKLIAANRPVDGEKLADAAFDLKSLL